MYWIKLYTSYRIPSEANPVNELGSVLLGAILTGFVDCVKARLHRRFLSRQLDAIFVAPKLHQVSNMLETPAISRRQIALQFAPGLHVRF